MFDLSPIEEVRHWATTQGFEVREQKPTPFTEGFDLEPPSPFSHFFRKVSDGYTFEWTDPAEDRRGGRFQVFSYSEALRLKRSLLDGVYDAIVLHNHSPKIYFRHDRVEDGLRLVTRRKYWWPVYLEAGDGSLVCIDETGQVVATRPVSPELLHTDMIIADSLDAFVAAWAARKFVEPSCGWQSLFLHRGQSDCPVWNDKFFPL